MKNIKLQARKRRKLKAQAHIKRMGVEKGVARLSITRSLNNISAQIFAPTGGEVLVSATSLEESVRSEAKSKDKKDTAKLVGQLLAKRAKEKKIDRIAVDRNGFKYHGRVAALVDAAREEGLGV